MNDPNLKKTALVDVTMMPLLASHLEKNDSLKDSWIFKVVTEENKELWECK